MAFAKEWTGEGPDPRLKMGGMDWESFKTGVKNFFGPGDYSNIASAGDYQMYDPFGYGASIKQNSFAPMAGAGMMMTPEAYAALAASGGSSAPWSAASYTPGSYNPLASFGAFMGGAPAISGMVAGATSPLQRQLDAIAQTESTNALRNIGQQFSSAGSGALFSGAAAKAMAAGAAEPFARVAADVSGRQVDMTNQLWNNLMGTMAGQFQFGGQLGEQSRQFGAGLTEQSRQFGAGLNQFDRQLASQNLFNAMNLASQNYGMGLQGLISGGNMFSGVVAPQYVYNPSGFERTLGYAGDIASAVAPFVGGGSAGGGGMGSGGGGAVVPTTYYATPLPPPSSPLRSGSL